MDRDELATRYLEAWDKQDVSALLKLMHPQGSYYDGFWCETCSGNDLAKYFADSFNTDAYWYQIDSDRITTPNGLIIRYKAFAQNDTEGLTPIYNGAEVISTSDGLIMTISDFYCDPARADLIEIASIVERQHGNSHVAKLGLSARTSARIKRRMTEVADKTSVYLDPSLTVTQLADQVGCSVMHLFHVLEEEKETTFTAFVTECRVRHATTMLADYGKPEIDIQLVAEQSGFASIEEFNTAFVTTFGINADEYAQRFLV